ncbi:uroporphyrinogen-III synthase [Aestuariicella hydrocarbonica]|uniref:Uroporphyrinogen-III synthase n=1 Tax=Pseudomaricurvus hydrocarbonicus TaxID=1470433 RepID=A0A9E5MP86_9GAMM|nr:uroporphyrinogen-III synthase [Aestuariicella hydrocarbonica]
MTELSDAALSGVRVLITRPQAQADQWQQLLQAAGAQTVRVPLLEIVPVEASQKDACQAIKNIVMDVSRYQHGIFVSQNAARYGLDWLEQYWPQMPLGLQFYAVGSATANYLQRAGYQVTAAGGSMNTEALLALPQLQDLSHQRVVIFRGQGGRPVLAEVLRERGAQVDYCELYQRHFPSAGVVAALDHCRWGTAGDVVSVHSGETLSNWRAIIASRAHQTAADPGRPGDQTDSCSQKPWKQLTLLVPGERVAAQAREWGFTNVVMAENASDACMLSTLADWRAQQPS